MPEVIIPVNHNDVVTSHLHVHLSSKPSFIYYSFGQINEVHRTPAWCHGRMGPLKSGARVSIQADLYDTHLTMNLVPRPVQERSHVAWGCRLAARMSYHVTVWVQDAAYPTPQAIAGLHLKLS